MREGLKNLLCRNVVPVLFAVIASLGWSQTNTGGALSVEISPNGDYSIGLPGSSTAAVTSGVAVKVDGLWLHSSDYPHHDAKHSTTQGILGEAEEWLVTWTGSEGHPDLSYRLRAYSARPFVELQVTVRNTTGRAIHVEAIRSIGATGAYPDLGGPATEDRVLSDSFSEDRPAEKIHDLGDASDRMQRGVGSQLIYNRQSHQSFFVGALTSDRFLTILRLHIDGSGDNAHITSWDVDSTGTTEMELENSLRHSPDQDRIELSLPVAPGGSLASEALLMSVGSDYHAQLDTYGSLIREIHHARVFAPPLLGWWSWTAYYFGLNDATAMTNAEWEAQHLKKFGYDVFHIDEGYQYARGEYGTPDAPLFPQGLTPLEYEIRGLGLTPGIWTAPFEVSQRSWVYQNHPDWLVKNAEGQPIHAGFVSRSKDQLYVLDTTNPGAQEYLRQTYRKLTQQWQIHYIKMDFMDDSAIEGYYYKPNTTAMEAQRVGLQIIRDSVGSNVLLDKDGSVMLNPVGFVDYGRISQDTGHRFERSKDAATGIAARYYMNRNFFVADPDAFTVSTQTIPDHARRGDGQPETLTDAQVSIVLAAVSGGMLEIGDDLPTLENEPGRLRLIENQDLINMVRLGRAARPLDLMSFAASDGQPSIFFLQESRRQSILAVFNWTERRTDHTIQLAELGLSSRGHYAISDVLDPKAVVQKSAKGIHVALPPHSVRVLK
ncbi:MAG TPA: alpha-galactosidase, partial [Acidobacteriaceae bacterium]